jgi:hypothetical protein
MFTESYTFAGLGIPVTSTCELQMAYYDHKRLAHFLVMTKHLHSGVAVLQLWIILQDLDGNYGNSHRKALIAEIMAGKYTRRVYDLVGVSTAITLSPIVNSYLYLSSLILG